MMRALVLIGDIVDSRKADNRSHLQQQFAAAIASMNGGRNDLASPYTVTLGDEFQAVFRSAERVLRDTVLIQAAMYPTKLRFSLAVGEITTALNRKTAIGMDGPAFYEARAGIEHIRAGEPHERYRVGGLSGDDWQWISSSLNLFALSARNWRKHRFDILNARFNNQAPTDIAATLGISKQAVYKNMTDGALDDIQVIFAHVSRVLEKALQ